MKNEANKLPKGLVRTIAFGFFLLIAVTVVGGFLSKLALRSGMQP